jgi:transaldolase
MRRCHAFQFLATARMNVPLWVLMQCALQNAIEKGLAAAGANKSTEALAKTDIEAAALDQALANVSGMLDPVVQGRIAVEVDPRLSDTGVPC